MDIQEDQTNLVRCGWTSLFSHREAAGKVELYTWAFPRTAGPLEEEATTTTTKNNDNDRIGILLLA